MVRAFLLSLFFVTLAFSAPSQGEDPLTAKIKSFLSAKTYRDNRAFINVIFEPKSAYYKNGRVDALEVVETLKENGLLHLYFKTPQEFQLNFKTSGYPIFFVKIMGDTLRNIGYYRYVTTSSNLDASEFTWSINLKSEYITDPLALEDELHKSRCKIIDIERNSLKEWTYVIDVSKAKLQVPLLKAGKKLKLKRSLYAQWFNVSKVNKLKIKSSRANSWHPYIAYYDNSLHLIKIIKKDKVIYSFASHIPKNATYVKISDLYTLKNVHSALEISASGAR